MHQHNSRVLDAIRAHSSGKLILGDDLIKGRTVVAATNFQPGKIFSITHISFEANKSVKLTQMSNK
jgi:hypothetical protein